MVHFFQTTEFDLELLPDAGRPEKDNGKIPALYRFIFPGEDKRDDKYGFDDEDVKKNSDLPVSLFDISDLVDEKVLIAGADGVPAECSAQVQKVREHHLAFIGQLLEEREKYLEQGQQQVQEVEHNKGDVYEVYAGKETCMWDMGGFIEEV
jgi:hypothetical protein